jgi:hypothetical protein
MVRRTVGQLAVGLALALVWAGCGMNEPSGTAVSLTGLVREAVTNALLAGVTVTVQSKSATTGADGRYVIENLTAGSAEVRATRQGHTNLTQTVALSGETTANLTMTPAPIAAFIGNWSGQWTNTTFGTSGTATMTFNADTVAETYQITADLNGSVFGQPDPEPLSFNGPYSATGSTVITIPSPFGNAQVTITQTGQITGSVTSVTIGNITRLDFSGTATSSTIVINYTVTFNGGATATGVLTLNK